MRITGLTGLMLCLVAVSQANVQLHREWDTFTATHKKTYTSALEREFRFKVFKDNLDKIMKHNKEYREGRATYSMGMNQFGDMLLSEVLDQMTGLKQNPNKNKVPVAQQSAISAEAPSSIDWREKGAVTGVKDQGNCGSCWSFSATGSLEAAHFRKTGQLVSLSEQNLMDCSWSYGNNACSGGIMEKAFQYVIDNGGIDTEESYPYEERNSRDCKYNAGNIGATATSFTEIPVGDENALLNAVGTVGPNTIGVNANSGWQFYRSGIFSDSSCGSWGLNHGVLAVGYGTEGSQDYWIVKNSWGPSWGEDGYIRLARGRNMCGLAQDASYPTE